MPPWINELLNSGHAGFTVLIAAFVMGIIGVFTCSCNFSLLAVVAGYSGTGNAPGKIKTVIGSGVAFLLGAIISMAIIGAIFGYAGEVVGNTLGNYWKVAAGLVCVFFGLYSMDFLPFRMPSYAVKSGTRKTGVVAAILFGLTVGGLGTAFNTCCNPLFTIILAASFVKGSTVWGFLMLSVFALGYALPLAIAVVGVKLGIGRMSVALTRAAKVIQYAGGILLIGMGFYFLITI